MEKKAIIILILFLIPFIPATCEDNQININTASLTELDKLTGIGPIKAQSIIDSRPFNNLNDLINCYGIGPATLQKIINQELACVEEEEKNADNEQQDEQTQDTNDKPPQQTSNQSVKTLDKDNKEASSIIILTSTQKNIKSEENNNKLLKTTYAKYGFIIFCILLGTLLILRKNKNQKTEFK